MKKINIKKQKQNQKNMKKDIPYSLTSIQQLIFEDVNNINKFNIIIEEFILNLQNSELEKVKNHFKIIKDIIDYFLIKNKEIVSGDLTQYLDNKIKMLISVFIDSFDSDNTKLNNLIFKYIFQLFEFLGQTEIKDFLQNLAEIFIYDDELTYDASNIKFLTANLSKHSDKLLLFTNLLVNKSDLTTNIIYNIYNFLITIHLSADEIDTKRNYQNLLINILNSKETSKEVISDLMLNLNKSIFDNLENPLILSDYLISIYEGSSGEEFDLKILSLNGLFVLISKYKLDYPLYFTVLYRTISITHNDGFAIRTVFDSQYRNRFIKILDLSLKTPNIPIMIILSFIKVTLFNHLEIGQIMPILFCR
jgi:hypothetical protein